MDEIATPSAEDSPDSAPSGGGSAKGPVRAYSPAVLSERQPRVIDFLPVRPLYVAVALLLGLTGVAAIEAIHIHAQTLPLKEGTSHLAAFDVAARGSLATWYSSLLLLGATGLALLVFAIRTHRVDDYRGRYRVWLWTTAALGWLSLDAATGIHDALGLAITMAAGKQVLTGTLAAGCTMTWLAVYGLLLGALGIRLAMEVWPSLPSFGLLLLAGLLYLCGGLIQLEMLPTATPLGQSVAESTVAMLAHLALVASIGFYARHVFLDASGRLKVHIDPDKKKAAKVKSRARLKVVKEDKAESDQPVEKPTLKPAAAPSSKPAEPAKFGAPAGTTAKSGATLSKSQPAYDDEDDEDEDESEFGGEKLSKSERKRLKKLARQTPQRRAA